MSKSKYFYIDDTHDLAYCVEINKNYLKIFKSPKKIRYGGLFSEKYQEEEFETRRQQYAKPENFPILIAKYNKFIKIYDTPDNMLILLSKNNYLFIGNFIAEFKLTKENINNYFDKKLLGYNFLNEDNILNFSYINEDTDIPESFAISDNFIYVFTNEGTPEIIGIPKILVPKEFYIGSYGFFPIFWKYYSGKLPNFSINIKFKLIYNKYNSKI
jgi:hypothetical protein